MPPKMEDAIAIAMYFNITLSDLFSRIELKIPSRYGKD
jgi:DNA-binding XRE family transcriptional regulator